MLPSGSDAVDVQSGNAYLVKFFLLGRVRDWFILRCASGYGEGGEVYRCCMIGGSQYPDSGGGLFGAEVSMYYDVRIRGRGGKREELLTTEYGPGKAGEGVWVESWRVVVWGDMEVVLDEDHVASVSGQRFEDWVSFVEPEGSVLSAFFVGRGEDIGYLGSEGADLNFHGNKRAILSMFELKDGHRGVAKKDQQARGMWAFS